MKLEVKVIGKDRIKAVLDRVEGGMEEAVSSALYEAAEKVKDDAKAYCPVDTGSLRKSIRKMVVARPSGNRWEISVRAGGYVVNPKSKRVVDYAHHVEYGTSRTRPQPFLRPALFNNRALIMRAISEGISRNLKSEGGK